MEDEENKKPEPEESVKKLNIVDEARAIRDEIFKAKEELKMQNDRRDKLNAEELLSSSAGGAVKNPEPEVETPKDYAAKVMANDL